MTNTPETKTETATNEVAMAETTPAAPQPVLDATAKPSTSDLIKMLGKAYAKDSKAATEGKWFTMPRALPNGLVVELKLAMAGDAAAFKVAMAKEMQKRGITQGDIANGQKAEGLQDSYRFAISRALVKGIRVAGDTSEGAALPVDEFAEMLKADTFLVDDIMAFANNRENYMASHATEDALKN